MHSAAISVPLSMKYANEEDTMPMLTVPKGLMLALLHSMEMEDGMEKGAFIGIRNDRITQLCIDTAAIPMPHAYQPSKGIGAVVSHWFSDRGITHFGIVHSHQASIALSRNDLKAIRCIFLKLTSLERFYAGLVIGGRYVRFYRFDRDVFLKKMEEMDK